MRTMSSSPRLLPVCTSITSRSIFRGRKLIGDKELILAVGVHDRPRKQSRIGDPAHRLLERGQHAEQRQELLGPVLASRRPQPGAGAAAHDQGNDRLSQFTNAVSRPLCSRRGNCTPRSSIISQLPELA